MSVSVNNLSKQYGKQLVVDDISFLAEKGKITGFLGPNGAGKSTTMKIATCFIPATNGTVEIEGLNVNNNPIEIKRKIGYLPEHNPLYLDMYVLESLEFTASLYGQRNNKARIASVIEQVGLGKEQGKKVGQLSKGYRQRVGLAQAIIHDPEVLILDEPLTGLDPNQIVEIRSLIKDLGKNKTVIFSTHIMQEVQYLCDKVIIINKGKIVADKSLSDLQLSDDNSKIVLVEFGKSFDSQSLNSLKGVISVITQSITHAKITYSPEHDIRPDLFNWAQQNNNAILSLRAQEESLETIFQKLTS
ncbi:MAG: gliding motility-associated ABC transporter ATP-binding subunit GldA [Opitutaceae bacterium]|nr:gliding motility-associated ABC transporter ATP-binding subunit GldA [Cytophagales bacterium]